MGGNEVKIAADISDTYFSGSEFTCSLLSEISVAAGGLELLGGEKGENLPRGLKLQLLSTAAHGTLLVVRSDRLLHLSKLGCFWKKMFLYRRQVYLVSQVGFAAKLYHFCPPAGRRDLSDRFCKDSLLEILPSESDIDWVQAEVDETTSPETLVVLRRIPYSPDVQLRRYGDLTGERSDLILSIPFDIHSRNFALKLFIDRWARLWIYDADGTVFLFGCDFTLCYFFPREYSRQTVLNKYPLEFAMRQEEDGTVSAAFLRDSKEPVWHKYAEIDPLTGLF